MSKINKLYLSFLVSMAMSACNAAATTHINVAEENGSFRFPAV